MNEFIKLMQRIGNVLSDGWNTDWTMFRYLQADAAIVVVLAFLGAAAGAWLAYRRSRRIPGKSAVIIPALLPGIRRAAYFRMARGLLAVLSLATLAAYLIALADPHTTLTREEVTRPGRRIIVFIDASGSMGMVYGTPASDAKLKAKSDRVFFTAAAAAEYFVQLRKDAGYEDLISLIEFGDSSYVISPFTTDYDTVLTAIRLISEPEEYGRFKDSGTKIVQAIDQAVQLFRRYKFYEAAGNVMVMFSDFEDATMNHNDKTLGDILNEGRKTKVPLYFVRTAYGKDQATGSYDEQWKATAEESGGKFYAAASEKIIVEACNDINRIATGNIKYARYSIHEPKYQFFGLIAVLTGTFALCGWLLFARCRKFP